MGEVRLLRVGSACCRVVKAVCRFSSEVVVMDVEIADGCRPRLDVDARPRVRHRGRCRRCEAVLGAATR